MWSGRTRAVPALREMNSTRPAGLGNEIGVENQQIFAFREAGAVFQRAGFVAGAVGPVDVLGVEPAGL